MKKRILLIFPHNFFELKSGVHVRLNNLCKYLRSRSYLIDLFALKNYESKWLPTDPMDKKIISKLYLYDWLDKLKEVENYNKGIKAKIKKILKIGKNKKNIIPDLTSEGMKKQFNQIVSANKYSFVIVAYVYWASLIDKESSSRAKNIILLEDFLSIQEHTYNKETTDLAGSIEEEIRRINLFDIAMSVSEFEYAFFSQFSTHTKHFQIPIFMKKRNLIKKTRKKYDVSFIGFNNIHNINGVNWFLDKVYPLLPKSVKIAIVGKVNDKINKLNKKNINYIPYIKNLDDLYMNTKVIISPLFSGTGLKVKIVEAASYGVPVVSTTQSLVGFPQKENNGCVIADYPSDFANSIVKLLSNKKYYRKKSDESLNFFLTYFEEKKIHVKLDKIFNQFD